jgi:hypothetical protein
VEEDCHAGRSHLSGPGVFGFTPPEGENNLPQNEGPWTPHGRMELTADRRFQNGVTGAEVLRGIDQAGYYIMRSRQLFTETEGVELPPR